jgi:hypothetical protein
MITPAEREGLEKVFTQAPSMPAKGQPMGDTREDWRYLAELYADSLVDMRSEISFLKMKINKLEQKGGGYVGLDK